MHNYLKDKRNSYESDVSKKRLQFCSNTSNFSVVTQEKSTTTNCTKCGKNEQTSKHLSSSSINHNSEKDKKEHNDTKQTFQSEKDQKEIDNNRDRRFSILDIPGNILPITTLKTRKPENFREKPFNSHRLKIKTAKHRCLLLLAMNK
jgi:DNA-directed RNA polymerase subunit M/transcription elongation factor TFIIS